jgi:hypothetical protein
VGIPESLPGGRRRQEVGTGRTPLNGNLSLCPKTPFWPSGHTVLELPWPLDSQIPSTPGPHAKGPQPLSTWHLTQGFLHHVLSLLPYSPGLRLPPRASSGHERHMCPCHSYLPVVTGMSASRAVPCWLVSLEGTCQSPGQARGGSREQNGGRMGLVRRLANNQGIQCTPAHTASSAGRKQITPGLQINHPRIQHGPHVPESPLSDISDVYPQDTMLTGWGMPGRSVGPHAEDTFKHGPAWM